MKSTPRTKVGLTHAEETEEIKDRIRKELEAMIRKELEAMKGKRVVFHTLPVPEPIEKFMKYFAAHSSGEPEKIVQTKDISESLGYAIVALVRGMIREAKRLPVVERFKFNNASTLSLYTEILEGEELSDVLFERLKKKWRERSKKVRRYGSKDEFEHRSRIDMNGIARPVHPDEDEAFYFNEWWSRHDAYFEARLREMAMHVANEVTQELTEKMEEEFVRMRQQIDDRIASEFGKTIKSIKDDLDKRTKKAVEQVAEARRENNEW